MRARRAMGEEDLVESSKTYLLTYWRAGGTVSATPPLQVSHHRRAGARAVLSTLTVSSPSPNPHRRVAVV